MFKSIFAKLLIPYLIVIVIIISSISFILSYVYSASIFNEKEKTFKSIANRTEMLVSDFYNHTLTKKELETALNSMGYVENASIRVLELNEADLRNPGTAELSNELMEGYLIQDLQKILQGESVFRRSQYTKAFDTTVVFLGVPLKISEKQEGVILIFSPVNQINSNITKMNLIILGISVFAILLSSIMIYMNSIRLSRPIKVMELAAKKIASGENTSDLDLPPTDEIGQLAVTFNYMKNKLIETENMRREFIANVSHDLRTPLTSINGFIEALIDGVIEKDEHEKYFKVIGEETNRLMKLTDDILQLSKIQSGMLRLSKEKLHTKTLLDEVTAGIHPSTYSKSVRFDICCPEDSYVYADKNRLKQILINLISNSIKYAYDSVVIEIEIQQSDQAIIFHIRDNGIGIEPDKLKFIFEKFYRVEKSRETKYNSTGLGLSIVKQLVALHGGSIRAVSTLGKGTEMIFNIPA